MCALMMGMQCERSLGRFVRRVTHPLALLAWAMFGAGGCAPAEDERNALLDSDPTVCPQNAGAGVSVLVCRQAYIGGLAIDAEFLYFLAGDTLDAPYANTVKRLSLAAGTVDTLAEFGAAHQLPADTTADNGSWLSVNSTELVWAVPSTGEILAMPKGGGEPRVLASDQDVPLRVVIDDTKAYWTNWGSCGNCMSGSVMSVALSGGPPTTIASKQDHPNGIALDRVNVYWVTAGGTVMQAPVVGGAPNALASGLMNPFFVTVDESTVYWTLPKGVMSCPTIGCNRRPTQVASGMKAPNVLITDSTALYFSDWDDGTVWKLVKGQRAPALLASNQEKPDVVVLGANSLYWYNAGPEGSIMRVPK
jgi:hypothetical protein